METKKFKIDTTESVKNGKKLGKSSILSKAGFTVAGGIAGASFAAAYGRKPKPETANEDDLVDKKPETDAEVAQPQQQTVHDDINEPENDMTEPQPVDSNQPQANNGPTVNSDEEVDPELIAQAITGEIDENDIDAEYVFTPDSYDYAYLPDGTRQMVIIGHTPDGTQFLLADVDGDGVYGDVFDLDGEFVAEVDGLSLSDLMEMIDDTGGYLAGMAEPWNDDPTEPLYGSEDDGDLADIEEVDEDDLLAQLTEEVGEEDDSDIDKYFEDETEESPEEEIDVDED